MEPDLVQFASFGFGQTGHCKAPFLKACASPSTLLRVPSNSLETYPTHHWSLIYCEYYRRFVPSESPECPCGEAPIQTHDHILIDCPLYDGARSHLRRASRSLCIPTLLGTYKGLKAVARFLTSSNAFSKVH